MAYPLPLDMAYRSSRTETGILVFIQIFFLSFFRANPTDCLSLVTGQFLKELRENTFSGSDNEDANEHIEKVLEIFHEVILFYNGLDVPTRQILDSRGAIPTKTTAYAKKVIQEMVEYSQKWHNGSSRGRRPHYTKDCPLKEEGKTLEEDYYTQFGGPFQSGGYRATAPGFYQRNNANSSYQEQRKSMEDTLSKFMGESAKGHEENSNNNTLLYKSRQMMIPFPSRLDYHYYEDEERNYGPKFAEAYGASHINDTIPRKEKDPGMGIGKFVFPVDFIILDMPKDIKVPLILERPFLSTARAKIDVYKRKITLTIGEENIIFKSVKPASSLIKRVYMWNGYLRKG
ncbi:putative reverse transcriptase domain-containing protein [Tanacetum coccineum]